jgi:osmoprotectant transport system ATP-binding protein
MNAAAPRTGASTVASTSSLRDALALMVAANSDVLAVVDESGAVRGQLTRDAIFAV